MASLTTITEEQAMLVPIRSFAAGDVVLSSNPWVWSFVNKYSKTLCAQCFRDSDSLRVCSSCMLYRYCDILCQSIDWEKEHKYECEHLKDLQKSMHDIPTSEHLRQNELMPMSFCVTLETRRKLFSTLYLRPCNCHGCTKEFDMQINPLKCWNKACATRIENEEDTARGACSKCQRPRNSYCLTKFIELTEVYDAAIARRHKPKELGGRLYRLEYSDIVQPYAHFRFVCGICSVDYLKKRGQYEKAWNLSCGLIECVRAIYPKYHLTRASWLMRAGVIPFAWARKMLYEEVEMKETEAERLKCLFTEMLLKALEWLSEAREIYVTLSGVDSKWADRIAAVMTLHPKLQERCAGSRVIPDALRNDLLLDELGSVLL